MNGHLLLQIVYPDGTLFQFPGGGTLEMDLERALAERLFKKIVGVENKLVEASVAKGVGLLRTSTQVEAAMRTSFREVVQIDKMFRDTFKEIMFEFKDRVANP